MPTVLHAASRGHELRVRVYKFCFFNRKGGTERAPLETNEGCSPYRTFLMACMAFRSTIADLGTSAIPPPVATTCSASGARVAVCSQKSHEYAIFYKPKSRPWRNSSAKERPEHLWPRIDAGTASQVRFSHGSQGLG